MSSALTRFRLRHGLDGVRYYCYVNVDDLGRALREASFLAFLRTSMVGREVGVQMRLDCSASWRVAGGWICL